MSKLCSNGRKWHTFYGKPERAGLADTVKDNRRDFGSTHAAADDHGIFGAFPGEVEPGSPSGNAPKQRNRALCMSLLKLKAL